MHVTSFDWAVICFAIWPAISVWAVVMYRHPWLWNAWLPRNEHQEPPVVGVSDTDSQEGR
jgi:hypothetical protein